MDGRHFATMGNVTNSALTKDSGGKTAAAVKPDIAVWTHRGWKWKAIKSTRMDLAKIVITFRGLPYIMSLEEGDGGH